MIITILIWLVAALVSNYIDRKYYHVTPTWILLNLSFGPIALVASVAHHIKHR